MVYKPFPTLLACCHATARSNRTFFFSCKEKKGFEMCLASFETYRKGLGLGLIHGYFGGAEKRYTHWWLKRSFFFVVAPKFIFNGGGSKDPTQDWWLK